MTRPFHLLKLALLVLICSTALWGQSNVGRISGTIKDSSGAVIPGCSVTVENPQTGFRQVTSTQDTGLYVFPSLTAGAYNVTAEMQGFKTAREENVVLDAASVRTVEIVLQIGAPSETVAVSASAEQVQTGSGEVSRVINDRQVDQIALNGRNYLQLLSLLPGTVNTSADPFSLYKVTNTQNINGVRTNSLYATLDGVGNLDDGSNRFSAVTPSVDTIAEVRVLSASYTAESGGRSGATMNVVTKSGTQNFRGTLFEFVRNDIFDARSFFAVQKDPLRFNNFGWTLGGPIFIPNKFNTKKDKLFFFAAEEWKYQHQGQNQLTTVPTVAERAGNFQGSKLAAPIDPLTGKAFPDSIVPQTRWSKNGPLLLVPYPKPNVSFAGGNYSVSAVSRQDNREDLIKIDFNQSERTQWSGRWVHDTWRDVYEPYRGGNLGIVGALRPRPGYIASLNMTHSFSPTLINTASFGATHVLSDSKPVQDVLKRSVLGLTYPELFPENVFQGAPNLSISGFTGYSPGWALYKYQIVYQWRDDLTKVIGNHVMKFGVLAFRSRDNDYNLVPNLTQGSVTFNTSAAKSTKNVIADVLLGNFQTYSEDRVAGTYWSRFTQIEFYGQDSWKVSKRLTLELGLRYSIIPPNYSALGNLSCFLPSQYSAANAPQINTSNGTIVAGTAKDPYNGIAFWGDDWPSRAKGRLPEADDSSLKRLFGILPKYGSKTRWTNFAPRIGFAYDPYGNGKTAIRGGFGIFFDRTSHDTIQNMARNIPFNVTAQIFDGNIDNPAGGTARVNPPSAYTNLAVKPSRIMSFNLSVQRELPWRVIADIGYVGTLGRNLDRTLNLNQLRPGARLSPPNSTIHVNALRPYLGYGDISYTDYGDNSNYNSLQVSVSRRMASGLSFGSAYTFSKTIDSTGGSPQDRYNVAADRALSSIHRAQVFSANLQYDLPFFKQSSSAAMRSVLGGWALSSVLSAQSGAPNNVTVASDVARIGVSSSRASLKPGADPSLASKDRTVARWFNTDAFLPVSGMTAGQFGNTGRNILIGPGFISMDLALMKNVRIRERSSLEFRAESFNLFNHANFTSIATTVTSANFGSVTGAGPGRVLAFGFKVRF